MPSFPRASGNSAGCGLVSGQEGILEIGATLDRESVVSTLFGSESRANTDRDQHDVHPLRDGKNFTESLNGKSTQPSKARRSLSENFTRLKQKLRQEIARKEIPTWPSRNSISLKLSVSNYIRPVNGLIKLNEIKSACMENWN